MGRAILSRSYEDLEAQILRNPQAPMETFSARGFTTLQLCAGWAQGLHKLLQTEAASLLDTQNIVPPDYWPREWSFTPIGLAIAANCAESVDLLMRAGCIMPFNLCKEGIFELATIETITIVASRMADRRRSLLELAQREPEHLQHEDPSHVPDGEAAYLCQALEKSGISIPRYLEVEWDYTTIYHYRVIPILHFRTYFDQGFRDFKMHNKIGLTPVMVWRDTFDGPLESRHGQIAEALVWLHEQGFLDQKAEDPWKIGLNIHATGWHYIAAMLGSQHQDVDFSEAYFSPVVPSLCRLVRKVSQVIRDCCACWCNPEGKGCSPLKLFLIAHDDREECWRGYQTDYLCHIFFHYNINITGKKGYEPADPTFELIRLLTFEALEMRHTCCALKHVNLEEKRLRMPSDVVSQWWGWPKVIANRDPEMVQKIKSDQREQENAQQLDTLMEEFTTHLKRLEPSPKALESFVWGYWRRRISKLFTVDIELLDETERVVEDVRTCESHADN
ncbi:hypothetical protein N0V83_004345 [Neocucurbitaria cava]|uniref:Uncharacterized protein n=1 Tax=Neocucurbitaria cava TaxID=798079 RepID=A0A9W9CM36_9PLEO|nr:hypothetical protein N0V83_004345 [Neocucurbitaria cava]